MYMYLEVTEKFEDLRVSSALGSKGKTEIICISHGQKAIYIDFGEVAAISFIEATIEKETLTPNEFAKIKVYNICLEGAGLHTSICIAQDLTTKENIMDFFNKVKHNWISYKREHSILDFTGFPIQES